MRFLRWFYPGVGVKRWLILFSLGVFLIAAGLAVAVDANVLGQLEESMRNLTMAATGRFISRAVRGVFLAAIGAAMALIAVQRIVRTIILGVLPAGISSIADTIYHRRQLARGPRVVALGGGTGLSVLLRGLKEYTSNITAIVTVTDDGGSSGRLREEMGVLPPGDIRSCLVALADAEPTMQKLFQYRFKGGRLDGHSFGNLFIAAMSELTGDFEEAVRESSRVLAIRGRVLPSTTAKVVLNAEFEDGTTASGETTISRSFKPIKRIFLEAEEEGAVRALPDAVEAIAAADLVVLGPGSLFTSVIPNLAVVDLADAIRETPAPVVYIVNIMTQPGETDGLDAAGHLRAVMDQLGPGSVDCVMVPGDALAPGRLQAYDDQGAHPVTVAPRSLEDLRVKIVRAQVIAATGLIRHDPDRLAKAILRLAEVNRSVVR
ncbi:MAG: gluconeogenesis factor YvcK family protein [Bacillota bacterium]